MRSVLVASFVLVASAPAWAQPLPPIRGPEDAVAQLGLPDVKRQREALAHLADACRGSFRHALRDQPAVLARVSALGEAGDTAMKRAALDTARCFSPEAFLKVLVPRLSDADPEVVSYTAEVAARVGTPAVVGPLLDALEKQGKRCLDPALPPAEVEVCVWLAYAPGSALPTADGAERPLRARAGDLVVPLLGSPHPKVREVSVETIAATRLRTHAAALQALLERERKKPGKDPEAFAKPSPPDLLPRFKARLATLTKGEP